jgi:Tfp pilus assembly protein PilX
MESCYKKIHQHKGSTLIITLILLFVITTLATISMKQAITSEKISNNFSNKELSFQSSEMVTQAAINWLQSQTFPPLPQINCNLPPCVLIFNSTINPEQQPTTWWDLNGANYDNHDFSGKYVIQFIGFIPDSDIIGQISTGKYFYKITAKGWDPKKSTSSITQTTIGIRL